MKNPSRTTRVLILVLLLTTIVISYVEIRCSALPQNAKILDPVYSVPVAVLPGGVFNATIHVGSTTIKIRESKLLSPGLNVTLVVIREYSLKEVLVLTLKVPENATPNLYDLYLVINEEPLISVRSVWILKEWPKELIFMHITDIHIGIRSNGVPSYEYYETAIALLNTLPVQFAVITGDNVDVGGDIASLKLFKRITNTARKPTFIIPGNHDHAQTDEESFRKRFYGAYIGPPTWYRCIGKFLIVGLDTLAEGYIDTTQLKWLESILAKYVDKVKILLIHHSFFDYATFGKIKGTWKEIEKLRNLYSSWRERLDSAKEFLRLIEEYNVNMVLAGHVHGDAVVLYNDKTWFVTTATTCAGLREADYRAFRIIVINEEGEVKQVGVPGKDPLKGPSSYNIEKAKILVSTDTSLTAYIYKIRIMPGFEYTMKNITLFMYVNATLPFDNYSFYGDTNLVKTYEMSPYGNLYVVKVVMELSVGEDTRLILSAYKDEVPPEVTIQMYTPRTPISGKSSLTVYIKAVDTGWGIDSVKLVCRTTTGVIEIPTTYIGRGIYQAVISPLRTKSLTVKATAVDNGGNVGESEEIIVKYKIPKEKKPEEKKEEKKEETKEEEEVYVPVLPMSVVQMILVTIAIVVSIIVIVILLRTRKH